MSKMSRATALSQALKKPVIPFVLVIPHDKYKTISLKFVRNIGMAVHPNNVKKKVQAFYCGNTDIKYILRTIQEFEDIADNHMQLVGFEYFRECLGGTTRKAWDAMNIGQPLTISGFNVVMRCFIDHYILSTDLAAQKLYIDNLKKPFYMTVRECADCLQEIGRIDIDSTDAT